MTGIAQVMAAGGVGAVTGSATLADTKAGATAIASITLNADGTITYVGNGCSGPARWFSGTSPPTHWCTNTVNSGSVPSVGAAALTPTTSTCLWQWNEGVVGTVSSTDTLRIYSDAAGTTIAGTITYTVTCQRTS